MKTMKTSIRAALAIASVVILMSSVASAQTAPDLAHAKEAYDRGVAAHARGDFARAAREFADADALAPSAVALQAALDAAVDADDPLIGGELLERSKRIAPLTPKLAQSVDGARKKLGGRAGRVRVTCPAGATCTAMVDGTSFDAKKPTWIVTGTHTVIVEVDGLAQSNAVDVKAGETVDVVLVRQPVIAPLPSTAVPAPAPALAPAPAPALAPAPAARAGLPPLVFWIGAGATVAAGAGAGFFMLATRSRHGDFVDAGCELGPAPDCASLQERGRTWQTRANVAIGVTAVLAVATVVIGAVFTDWNGSAKKSALRLLSPGYPLRF